MTDPYLSIVSGAGTIDLNGIAQTGTGVQSRAGVTGLGLPPMNVAFDTGAGDGQIFIAKSVSARSLDVPISIWDESRGGLKEQMRALAMVITRDDLKLRWTDGDDAFELDVHLVSGGDYVYGQDTAGWLYANTTLTFQSESPYWKNVEEHRVDLLVDKVGETTDGIDVFEASLDPAVNNGSVATYPTFTVTGKFGNIALTRDVDVLNADGSTSVAAIPFLTYDSDLSSRVVIDCESGSVTSSGINAYANLGPAPTFFALPPAPDLIPGGKVQITDSVIGTMHQLLPDPRFRGTPNTFSWLDSASGPWWDTVVGATPGQGYSTTTVSYDPTKRLADGSGVFIGKDRMALGASVGTPMPWDVKSSRLNGNVFISLPVPQSAAEWDIFNRATLSWWCAESLTTATTGVTAFEGASTNVTVRHFGQWTPAVKPVLGVQLVYRLANLPAGSSNRRAEALTKPQRTTVYGQTSTATEDVSSFTGVEGQTITWSSYTTNISGVIPSSVIPTEVGGTNSDGKVVDKILLAFSLDQDTYFTRPSLTDYTELALPWGNWSGDTADTEQYEYAWQGDAYHSTSRVLDLGTDTSVPAVSAQWHEREWLVI